MPKEIARQWLVGAANSAAPKDPDLHMGIIPKRLTLHGMPGFDNIDYDAWSNLIKNIVYKSLTLISVTHSHRLLKTLESVMGTDGTVNKKGVEMLLKKEKDSLWRRVQEHVLPEAEAISDNFLS